MQRKLIAVEAYAPDDMDDGEIAREIRAALDAAAAEMRTEVSHVRTLL